MRKKLTICRLNNMLPHATKGGGSMRKTKRKLKYLETNNNKNVRARVAIEAQW